MVGGNTSQSAGGGISAANVTLARSTLSGNTAGISGGGISTGNVTVTDSTLSGNPAALNGGGIYATTATVARSTLSGNSAGTLLNDTIVENLAHNGGGVFHQPGGAFSVENTLIALNLVDFTGTGPDVFGVFASFGQNLIGDGVGGSGFTGVGDMVGDSANPIDPKIGPLKKNGGPTWTHAQLAGSPAIDAGDNAGVPATDQRGFPRIAGNGDGLAVVDIGAFEL